MARDDTRRVPWILMLLLAGFLWMVLASSDDNGPEWSGVSHVDGR